MNINATFVGYAAVLWFPLYIYALYAICKGSQFTKGHIIVGVIIYPFILITPLYLILLAFLRKEKSPPCET